MQVRELSPWGSHVFVFARPKKRDWSHYDGTFLNAGRDEFRPCMIRGHTDDGQRLYTIGCASAFMPEDFEIGSDCASS